MWLLFKCNVCILYINQIFNIIKIRQVIFLTEKVLVDFNSTVEVTCFLFIVKPILTDLEQAVFYLERV